jgi:hypothetical protein
LKQKINSTLTESTQSDELFEYLGEFDLIFETNLGFESGNRVGDFDEKNRSKKSRASVPLTGHHKQSKSCSAVGGFILNCAINSRARALPPAETISEICILLRVRK